MKKTLAIIFAAFGFVSAHATTNEITVQVVFQAVKDSAQVSRQPGTIQDQWTGTRYYTRVYDLTTTNTVFEAGGITSPGWAYFRNVSTSGTAYVSFSNGTFTNLALLTGQMSLMRLSTLMSITNIQASAASGLVQLEATTIEK